MLATIALFVLGQTIAQPPLIPSPKSIDLATSQVILPNPITISSEKGLEDLAQVLAEEVRTAYSADCRAQTAPFGTIRLMLDKKLEPEQYVLTLGAKITVEGGSYQAVAMGTTTLLQSLKPFGKGLSLPVMVVEDKPAKAYRGLLIDVARKYHSIETLKQCVELCRLYKVRYLQLHLSDDQAFTFPSKAFPELTTVNQHGGPSYTMEELADLVKYADARAVTIVPEIDMPGHCAALIRANPELFKIANTKPYEHHATINFANDKVIEAMDTIIGEVCDVFGSSPYFHMGGDEADIANADQHPDFQALFSKFELPKKSQQEIFRRFIGQVDEMVKKRQKQLIVWEGFGRDEASKFPIPKDVLVMEFENSYFLPNDLLKDGYHIVNASWTPLYVVNKHVWPPQKIFDWNLSRFGRFSNLYSATEWMPVSSAKAIDGAQVCAWEQPEYLEITNLRRIVPTMAERVWDLETRSDFASFSSRLARCDALLSRLIEPVEIVPSGLNELSPDDFDIPSFTKPILVTLQARSGGEIRYTLDGSAPTATSPVYDRPIKIDQTATVRCATFDKGARSLQSSMTFYYVPPKMPNLATGKKVTVSGGTQGAQKPELAVDDNLDLASSWWADPAPQWLQVDLGEETAVDRVELFPYWDGRRSYQYTIEVSINGRDWTKIADKSANTVPASANGDEYRFDRRPVRYVRVNMLKGSANAGVHIVELRVWPPKDLLGTHSGPRAFR